MYALKLLSRNYMVYFCCEQDRKSNSRVQNVTILGQALGSLSLLVDGLTDISIQFVPQGTPYDAVRAGVTGALILCGLSLVKGVLSLFMTIGTLLLGAFVAVRIYGTGLSDNNTIVTEPSRRNSCKARKGPKPRKKRDAIKSASTESGDSVAGLVLGFISSSLHAGGDNDLLEVTFKPDKKSRAKRKKE